MTNVKIHNPSDEIIQKANEEINITDARGRVITLCKPHFLFSLRIDKILGANLSANQNYVAKVNLIAWVKAIDGNDVGPLASELQIEALWQRLDEDGINALLLHFSKNINMDESSQEAVLAIKKLQGMSH